jgi:hypothetical protein
MVALTMRAFTAPGTASVPIAEKSAPEWKPAALASIEGLVDRLRAAGIACDAYEPFNPAVIASDYDGRLPIPAAMGECSSSGENLTFEVFASSAAMERFRESKLQAVCKAVAAKNLRFTGFAYVLGDRWIVEPDERSTADRIAVALDGESKMGTCE